MYSEIIKDFFAGFFTSIRIDLMLGLVSFDPKLLDLIIKIGKWNFMLHILPLILVRLIDWSIGISLAWFFNVIVYPINLVSLVFHLFHYMDLVNIVCPYAQKISGSIGKFDLIGVTVTMILYQIAIYLTTNVVNLVISIKSLAIGLNCLIMIIYHSFYYFNNLWQYKQLEMPVRIDIHEKIWPYYMGYGIVSTIIYFHSGHPFILAIYNLYMICAIAIPFLVKTKYPKTQMPYPSINLTIFSYLTRFLYRIFIYLLGFFSK